MGVGGLAFLPGGEISQVGRQNIMDTSLACSGHWVLPAGEAEKPAEPHGSRSQGDVQPQNDD